MADREQSILCRMKQCLEQNPGDCDGLRSILASERVTQTTLDAVLWATTETQYTVDCAKVLLDAGANPNGSSGSSGGDDDDDDDDDKEPPLRHAVCLYNLAHAFLLLERGASPECPRALDPGGYSDVMGDKTTLLMEAVCDDRLEQLVEALLAHGADVCAASSKGNTPLHFACGSSSLENVRRLLDAGGSPFARNSDGRTPFDLAEHGDGSSFVVSRVADLMRANECRRLGTLAIGLRSLTLPTLVVVEIYRHASYERFAPTLAKQWAIVRAVQQQQNVLAQLAATGERERAVLLRVAAFAGPMSLAQLAFDNAADVKLLRDIGERHTQLVRLRTDGDGDDTRFVVPDVVRSLLFARSPDEPLCSIVRGAVTMYAGDVRPLLPQVAFATLAEGSASLAALRRLLRCNSASVVAAAASVAADCVRLVLPLDAQLELWKRLVVRWTTEHGADAHQTLVARRRAAIVDLALSGRRCHTSLADCRALAVTREQLSGAEHRETLLCKLLLAEYIDIVVPNKCRDADEIRAQLTLLVEREFAVDANALPVDWIFCQ